MAHTPYHYDWNVTPTGNEPPADTSSPLAFLQDFAGINVQGLDPSSQIFLPSANRMQQEISMARYGLGNDLSAQRLSGQGNLLNMTGGMGISSMPQGFGRRQSNITAGLRDLNQQYQTNLSQAMGGYRGDVLDAQFGFQDALTTALGNIQRSGEDEFTIGEYAPSQGGGLRGLRDLINNFRNQFEQTSQPPPIPSGYDPVNNTMAGIIETGADGFQYRWNGSSWNRV